MRALRLVAGLVAVSAGLLTACADAPPTAPEAASSAANSPDRASPERAVPASLPDCPQLTRASARPDGLPDLTLPCLGNGPAVRLADLRSVPTVVNVWAAWCTNCDREMPLFSQLQKAGGDRLRVFGVHYKAPRGFGLQSAADFGVSFPSVHDEDGDRTAEGLGAPGPPTTLFVTADGAVAGRKIGEIRSFDQLTDLVRRHLGVVV